jgi:hypothetical protein
MANYFLQYFQMQSLADKYLSAVIFARGKIEAIFFEFFLLRCQMHHPLSRLNNCRP